MNDEPREILPPRRVWLPSLVADHAEAVEAWLIFNGARRQWVAYGVADGWEHWLDGPVPSSAHIEPDGVYDTREAAEAVARDRMRRELEYLEGEGARRFAERITDLRRRLEAHHP